MADTYYSLTYHLIFGVYNRYSLIVPDIRPRMHQYLATVLKSHGQLPLCVGGVGDHVHIMFASTPKTCIPDLVKELKVSSTKWMNENHLCLGRFQWQRGYGIFTVSRSHREKVSQYIKNQEHHHAIYGFAEEFKRFLELNEITYVEKYLPYDPENEQ